MEYVTAWHEKRASTTLFEFAEYLKLSEYTPTNEL